MRVRDEPLIELRQLAGQSVPRYTSYPTAPHFAPGLGADTYSSWLAQASARRKPVSLYLHIPFCREMCHYCGCNTKATRQVTPIRAYAETLRREIDLVASVAGRMKVSHIHWGGGTPNLLPTDSFEAIVADLSGRFEFLPGMEHAIELDPRHVTREGAGFLARMGITRASLGVQDMNGDVQRAIGRIQPLEQVSHSVDVLRAAGIEALNFDVMYGLPGQTVVTIHETARQVASFAPSRIALFGYAHVPWMKPHQRLIDETALPDSDLRIDLARAARRVFKDAGYEEIGIDHFARPDDELSVALRNRTLRRNFQGYTTDLAETLIGLGASSIGRTGLGLVQNAVDSAGWRRAIEARQLPVARGKVFEGEDVTRAAVIEELLCFFDVDLAEIARQNGVDSAIFDRDVVALGPFVAAGWVSRDGGRIAIVEHKHEIARLVASKFDPYLANAGRHSAAV